MSRWLANTRFPRLDLLGDEHAAHRPQPRVALEELDVAGQPLDPVDLAAALDLDRDGVPVDVAAQQVDRADVCRVLTANERRPGAMAPQLAASSSCRWDSRPSFHSLVGTQVVARVGHDLVERDRQGLALGERTVQTASPWSSIASLTVLGAFIQLSGL